MPPFLIKFLASKLLRKIGKAIVIELVEVYAEDHNEKLTKAQAKSIVKIIEATT